MAISGSYVDVYVMPPEKPGEKRTKVYPQALVEYPNLLRSATILGRLYRQDVDAESTTMAAYEIPYDALTDAVSAKPLSPTPPWYLTMTGI